MIEDDNDDMPDFVRQLTENLAQGDIEKQIPLLYYSMVDKLHTEDPEVEMVAGWRWCECCTPAKVTVHIIAQHRVKGVKLIGIASPHGMTRDYLHSLDTSDREKHAYDIINNIATIKGKLNE